MKQHSKPLRKLLDVNGILEMIDEEIKNEKLVAAVLLVHSFLEAYLIEIFLHSGIYSDRAQISSKTLKEIERLPLQNLLNINLILGKIDQNLYDKIKKFNKFRNEIVHKLFAYNFKDPKTRKEITKQITNGKNILKELSQIYVENLKKRTMKIRKEYLKQ